ncbi:MAG TPA: DinB family protein [Phototrophicaceae bacterium]|jgi:uncharacterized damage-inducible protein DinB|nr:DinB family protein [Phototrophicaceae bacterium]
MELAGQLIDTWNIHQRIVLYLLDAVESNGLKGVPAGMKGRSVGELFAHLHNIRLTWLEVSAPETMAGLAKIKTKSQDDKDAITKDLLRASLTASSVAITTMFEAGISKGKVKNMPPHLMASFGYFVAHEWYHIGEICMTLTQAGHKLDDKILYGLWEWKSFTED